MYQLSWAFSMLKDNSGVVARVNFQGYSRLVHLEAFYSHLLQQQFKIETGFSVGSLKSDTLGSHTS